MVISKEIINYIVNNKIVVWCTKVEEAKSLAKHLGGVYLDWNPCGDINGFEVFLTKNSANWQGGNNKNYFIKHHNASKCIDYKDLFNIFKPIYELW